MQKSLRWSLLILLLVGAGVVAGATRAVAGHYLRLVHWPWNLILVLAAFWLFGSGNQKTADLVDPRAVEQLPPDKREQFNELAEEIDDFNSWSLPRWTWGVILACVVIIAGSVLSGTF